MQNLTEKELAEKIVNSMYENDRFSQWVGMERVLVDKGKCVLRMTVREEMLNGHDILHGGIAYSLADSCLAFAANSHGRVGYTIQCTINYIAAVRLGDVLTATAEELYITRSTAVYDITIRDQHGHAMAEFRGTIYRTNKEFFRENE